jgi:hypothetical protein
VQNSVDTKKSNIDKLKKDLQQAEKDTETRLTDIDNGNIQLKVCFVVFVRQTIKNHCIKKKNR